MSIRALNEVAAQRDQGAPLRLERHAEADKSGDGALPIDTFQQAQAPATSKKARKAKAAKATAAAESTQAQGYLDLLVAAIPTEPLALYTFLVAGIVSTIGSDNQRLTMRWIIFVAAIVFIAAWIVAAYLRLPGKSKRVLPWAEVSSALVAFAAWGLVMPESPLLAELSTSNRTIWTFIIITAGVALLGLLTGSMKKPAKPEEQGQATT